MPRLRTEFFAIKGGTIVTHDLIRTALYTEQLALFLKSEINFVRSNDIQCEIYVDQSYEILSLLYYRDCFNL